MCCGKRRAKRNASRAGQLTPNTFHAMADGPRVEFPPGIGIDVCGSGTSPGSGYACAHAHARGVTGCRRSSGGGRRRGGGGAPPGPASRRPRGVTGIALSLRRDIRARRLRPLMAAARVSKPLVTASSRHPPSRSPANLHGSQDLGTAEVGARTRSEREGCPKCPDVYGYRPGPRAPTARAALAPLGLKLLAPGAWPGLCLPSATRAVSLLCPALPGGLPCFPSLS